MPPKRKDSGEELQAEIRKAAEDGANADDVGGDAADAELAAKRRLLAATRRKLRPRQTQIKVQWDPEDIEHTKGSLRIVFNKFGKVKHVKFRANHTVRLPLRGSPTRLHHRVAGKC